MHGDDPDAEPDAGGATAQRVNIEVQEPQPNGRSPPTAGLKGGRHPGNLALRGGGGGGTSPARSEEDRWGAASAEEPLLDRPGACGRIVEFSSVSMAKLALVATNALFVHHTSGSLSR